MGKMAKAGCLRIRDFRRLNSKKAFASDSSLFTLVHFKFIVTHIFLFRPTPQTLPAGFKQLPKVQVPITKFSETISLLPFLTSIFTMLTIVPTMSFPS